MSNIDDFVQKSKLLKELILSKSTELKGSLKNIYGEKEKNTVFISICDVKSRARVFNGTANTVENAWKSAINKCKKYVKTSNLEIKWVKADVVNDIKQLSLLEFKKAISKSKKYYFREGISFDPNFNIAFLEQEINGNALVKYDKNIDNIIFNNVNVNHYLKTYYKQKYKIDLNKYEEIYLFNTYQYICDHDNNCYELYSNGLNKGRRIINNIDEQSVYKLVDTSSVFLANQVTDSGKFTYGYFSAFAKEIEWYNILRHSSTIYSMIEAFELTHNEQLIKPINRAIEYLVENAIVETEYDNEKAALVVDKTNDNEIKLGATAATLLALTKYTKIFNDDKYTDLMHFLGNGILTFQDENTGNFVHVKNYPTMNIKEKFRIIYYDGEACFSLMRLFDLNKNSKWINAVEKAFDYFLKNDYWKNHDHWLSYCTNELLKYRTSTEYFKFGLKNAEGILDFSLNRITTYPTLLELLMACYNMIERLKDNKEFMVELSKFDYKKLKAAVQHRADYQLNGYLYPEISMYFKKPELVLGSFFVRHHSFRVRIDDIEHYISGYCNYYNNFLV